MYLVLRGYFNLSKTSTKYKKTSKVIHVITASLLDYTDPENELDEDLEIEAGIVRTTKEDTGVPAPHTPVLTDEEYKTQGTKHLKCQQ